MKKTFALLLACALLCALCAPAFARERTVMTSFYPVYILCQNVLAGVPDVRVSCMTAPGTGCLHDYQLLTGDLRKLAAADALCVCGAGMERFLPDVLQTFPDLRVIDCSQSVALMENAHGDVHEEEHDDHDEDHEDHDHGEYNAHIWLDAQNAVLMVENLRAGLCALYPEHAAQISDNAKSYTDSLLALDDDIRQTLSALEHRDIVTFHEAFPYFAKAYGLNVVAVVTDEPDEPLSPAMLKLLVETVKSAGCPPLFTEPQYESRAAQTVAAETGARMFALDPLVTGDGAMDAYQTVMRQNAQTLLTALCAPEQ